MYNMKDVLVGANLRVRISEVMELVVKPRLRNKKKIKVIDDGSSKEANRVKRDKVEYKQDGQLSTIGAISLKLDTKV